FRRRFSFNWSNDRAACCQDAKFRRNSVGVSPYFRRKAVARCCGWLKPQSNDIFRDVLLAMAQIARGPFEAHIREHLVWPDASRSPKQTPKMSRTQKPTKVAMDTNVMFSAIFASINSTTLEISFLVSRTCD